MKVTTMARKKGRDQYVVAAVLLVEANVQCSNRGAYQCYTSGLFWSADACMVCGARGRELRLSMSTFLSTISHLYYILCARSPEACHLRSSSHVCSPRTLAQRAPSAQTPSTPTLGQTDQQNAGRRWRGAGEQESASARIPVRERESREACFKPQPLDEERGRGGEEEERLRGMPRRWRGRFSHCVSTVERVSAIAMAHSLTSNARS